MDRVEKEIEEQRDFFREIAGEIGDAFFRSLAMNVSKAAGSHGAMVAEFAGAAGGRMRTIAVWMHGKFVDNFDCDLPGNLCDRDVSLPAPLWTSDLERLPHFNTATAGSGQQECAIWPLTDSSGRSLGLLIIVHPQHRAAQDAVREMLRLVSRRLSRELERRRTEALLAGEKEVLELLAKRAPLRVVVSCLARVTEESAGDVACAILLPDPDGKSLRLAAAPNLPGGYPRLIEDISIGPEAGPSGRAAFCKQQVIVRDISTDPFRSTYLAKASKYNIRSAWATPILSGAGEVLAIVTLYCRSPRAPAPTDSALIDRAVRLAEIAIGRRREEADERLRMSEMRLAKAQEIAHLGTWERHLKSGQLYWSEETFRILGVSPSQEITIDLFFSRVAPEEREIVRKAIQKALEEKRPYAIDYRIVLPDGTERYVQEQAEIESDAEGNPLRLIGTVQDVTQSRRLQDQLRQAQKMEAVGQLAGGVAHDFNNLLTAVIGHSELLLHKLAANHPLRQEIEEIKKAGERAALLTRQLLAFSRKQVLQPVVLDLNSMVESMSKMLRRLIREDIHLVTVPYPDLWFVKADPGQMQQVILNLVLNARDAMPKGGMLTIGLGNVELHETHHRRQIAMKPGRYVVLAVSDSGEGMNTATQARIFEPFFTTKEQGKGTGLGLSTVYGIIKQSGGYIWVDSEPGKGATFEIYLPQAEGPFAPDGAAAETPLIVSTSRTILLVEDDASVRIPIRRMLERRGYRMLEANDAEEALQAALSHKGPLDLMLTDVVMPRMSGRQLADKMAALYPAMKILYMSGYADDALVREAAMDQGRDFIEKPFTSDALVRRVREVLGDSPVSLDTPDL